MPVPVIGPFFNRSFLVAAIAWTMIAAFATYDEYMYPEYRTLSGDGRDVLIPLWIVVFLSWILVSEAAEAAGLTTKLNEMIANAERLNTKLDRTDAEIEDLTGKMHEMTTEVERLKTELYAMTKKAEEKGPMEICKTWLGL
jgi:hypothetical protein